VPAVERIEHGDAGHFVRPDDDGAGQSGPAHESAITTLRLAMKRNSSTTSWRMRRMAK
jgi:hypothetical protein